MSESTVPGSEFQRPSLVEWLRRANSQVAEWAASLSWWRLIFLFLLVLFASAMVSDQLRLKHERTRVPRSPGSSETVASRSPGAGETVVVTIDEKEGIQIKRRSKGDPAGERAPAASEPAGVDGGPASPKIEIDKDADVDEDDRFVTQRVFTFRGLLGDVGATVMIIFFAYLTAAKIIVRKVAQADAKVRTAVDAAEHEAMERQLAQAQLQVLQAQVEPHFLFNTLAAVDFLIETDPARASQMQKKLITYLRGALPQMRQESSTVGREMRLIRSYLDLIKMRIEDRLEVEILVPETLESASFPPMMLQSLVENAIKHGIEPKPEGGKVTVAARLQRGMLWMEVRDTGVGLPNLDAFENPPPGSGIGLQNIRERLAMLYPGKGRLTLMSDERMGTLVRIGVPYETREEPAAAGEQPKEQPA